MATGLALWGSLAWGAAGEFRRAEPLRRPEWLAGAVGSYRRAAVSAVSARVLRARDAALRALRDAPATDAASLLHRTTAAEFGAQRAASELAALESFVWVEAVNGLIEDSEEIARAQASLQSALRRWTAARAACRAGTGKGSGDPRGAARATAPVTPKHTKVAEFAYPSTSAIGAPPACPGPGSADPFGSQIDSMMNNNLAFFAIQTKVQNISQTLQSVSNIMKADSDAKLNAIRNVRS